MPQEIKADAVKVPIAVAGGGGAADKQARVANVARSLMGLDPKAGVNVVAAFGGYFFARPQLETHELTARQSMLYAKGHPSEGRERYEWVDRGDGVLLGFLGPDPAEEATPEPDPSRLADNLAARAKELPWLAARIGG